MDNYVCDYEYFEGDMTIHFKCNNKIVYKFIMDFDILYNNFISLFDHKGNPQRYEFLNSNGVIQINHNRDFLSFEVSRYGSDVYVDTSFTIKITDQFVKLINNLHNVYNRVNPNCV